MLCYWPVVKGSIVLPVSPLGVVQRLGRRAVGVGAVGGPIEREGCGGGHTDLRSLL